MYCYLFVFRNGFYPFLGYRFGGSAADQEEEDEVPVSTIDSVTGNPHVNPASTTASTTNSRKHSNTILPNNDALLTNRHHSSMIPELPDPSESSPAPDTEANDVSFATMCAATVAASTVLLNPAPQRKHPSHSKAPNTTSAESKPVPEASSNAQTVTAAPATTEGDLRRRSLPNSFNDYVVSTTQLKDYVKSMLNGVVPSAARGLAAAEGTAAANNTPSELANVPYAMFLQTATNAREKRVRQQSACLHHADSGAAAGGMRNLLLFININVIKEVKGQDNAEFDHFMVHIPRYQMCM